MAIKDDRKEFEKQLAKSPDTLSGEMPLDPSAGMKMEPTFDMDFHLTKKNCKRRARSMIKRATGLMMTNEMIADNPYLKNKMQVDIISLTGMLYQLEVNEMMQKTLMEEVRAGAAHPRMFEVFGNLSKTIGELNKQLLQTVEAIKLTYKDVKQDITERDESLMAIGPGEQGVVRAKDGIRAIGTKDLIKEAKKLKIQKQKLENENIQDIEEIKE